MPRVTIQLPENFNFFAHIPVRITDLNYGNHVGNDSILSIMHEARVQYLQSINYSELDLDGISLIMRDVAIQYKAEAFYGDQLQVWVKAGDFSGSGFSLFYKLDNTASQQTIAVAHSGMVCFDYTSRRIVRLPDTVRMRLEQA